jgi:hypothetical protein
MVPSANHADDAIHREREGATLLKPDHSANLFQFRPSLPLLPARLKLRLGHFKSRHLI